jgi:exodeoxyribonuclease VII small subunit
MNEPTTTDTMTYEKASRELNSILDDLKTEKVPIDLLAEKVERAAKLATFCNEKLRATEARVSEIVKRLGL